MLLRRYGIVFRELLSREPILRNGANCSSPSAGSKIVEKFRGGRFVSGFLGEQFALSMAVESLRAARISSRPAS